MFTLWDRGNTLGQGDIPPAGTDAELIDHANEIAGGDARFLEDLCEQCILDVRVSEELTWALGVYLLLLGPWPIGWIRHVQIMKSAKVNKTTSQSKLPHKKIRLKNYRERMPPDLGD